MNDNDLVSLDTQATLAVLSRGIATQAEADFVLRAEAVATAGERLWKQAKDPTKLFEAITVKLFAQMTYAAWRPEAVQHGGDRKSRSRLQNGNLDLPTADPGDLVVHRWRKRLCRKVAANNWTADNEKLRVALDDAAKRCVRICEQEKDGTIRGTEGTGEFERYTPARYIDLAREVMGEIDLDPASSEYAQKTVKAWTYYTAADDGLSRAWHGRVWLNPPYHRELAPLFIAKLLHEWDQCTMTAAIMLTNNSTDTQWFNTAALVCDVICFTDHRIPFEVPGAAPVSPTQGQAFFYFGPNVARFVQVFGAVGWCAIPTLPEIS